MSQDLHWMFIFCDLYDFVTSFALRKICDYYKHICKQSTAIESCINIFTRTMKLSCVHKIQKRLYNKVDNEVLKLQNIHHHWLYIKSSWTTTAQAKKQENNTMSDYQDNDESDDEHIKMQGTSSSSQILQIQKSVIVRVKNRLSESQNQLWVEVTSSQLTVSQWRRQQTFEDFTQRQLFDFELISKLFSSQMSDSQLQSQREDSQRDECHDELTHRD